MRTAIVLLLAVAAARSVFVASLIYLPLVLGLMVADRGVPGESVVPWSSVTAAEAGE